MAAVNGLVDCADPACAPVATCVPAVAGASYGTLVSGSPLPSCPQANATAQMLYGDFVGGTCSGCTSSASGTPSVTLFDSCGGSTIGSLATACSTPYTIPANFGVELTGVSCSQPVGTATLNPGSFTTDEFCVSPAAGAGCAAGSVCVPTIGADRPCILVDATTSCTQTGYASAVAPSHGTWYTDKITSEACNSCAKNSVGIAWLNLAFGTSSASTCGCPCIGINNNGCAVVPAPYGGAATYYPGLTSDPAYCEASTSTTGTFAGAGSQMNVCCM